MRRALVSAWLLLLLPGLSFAQNVPERLLPAGSQIYLSWDGMEAHRAAFDKTALGKTLQGDTGKMLSALWAYGTELLDTALANGDQEARALIKDFQAALGGIAKGGFTIGIELKSINPPQAQAVLVFRGSGGDKSPLLSVIQRATTQTRANVQQSKVGPRTVHAISEGPVHFGWWSEPDNDAVIVVGTNAPADLAKAVDAKQPSFAGSAAYKKLKDFNEFPTWARAQVDVAGLFEKVAELAPQAGALIDELGLKGLKGISFVSGFDGPAERAIVDIDIPGPRKGLLALINRKTFTLADLPALPSDVSSFSASNFNVGNLYKAGVTIAEAAAKVFAPDAVDIKEAIRQVEALIGIRFDEDLFGTFGDLSVSYSSPSEGVFGLSSVYMFKLKDEKKLAATLESIFKAIPPFPGAELAYKKRDYRGGEIMELTLKADAGEYSVATMSIHKGWFLFGSFPQPLYGHILRTKGDLPVWKASDELTKALAAFPKEFVSVSVSDPRPTLQFLLGVLPPALTIANSALPQVLPNAKPFDVGVIPHAQDAVRHLFPNITIVTDDGKRIRSETRASLALPF